MKSIDQEIARQTRTMDKIRGQLDRAKIQKRIRRRNGIREEEARG